MPVLAPVTTATLPRMSTVGALVIGPSMLEGKASVVAYRMPPMPTSVRGSSSSVSRRLSGNSSNSPSTGAGARLVQVGGSCVRGTVGRCSAGCETRQSTAVVAAANMNFAN